MTKPSRLYAWIDSSDSPQVIYTDTLNITTGTLLYDNTGTTINYTVGSYNNGMITKTSSSNTGGDSNLCCIPYYTQVNYFDGTTKNAEDVKIGDKLLGYNESTQEFVEVEVLNVIHKIRNQLVKVKTRNYEIEITPEHPILTDQGWAVYDLNAINDYDFEKIQLDTSLKLLTEKGKYEKIISIKYNELDESIDVYTFNITDGIDTYVANGIISHNIRDKCN